MRNSTKILTVALAIAAVAVLGHADDERRVSSGRTDADIVRPEGVAQETIPGNGEQVVPQLEAGLMQINADFRGRMDAIKVELSAATTEEARAEIQQRAQQLKVEWTLAIADRQLQLAREAGDTQTEAQLLQAIAAMQAPRAAVSETAPRDPNAGIVIEGGAK